MSDGRRMPWRFESGAWGVFLLLAVIRRAGAQVDGGADGASSSSSDPDAGSTSGTTAARRLSGSLSPADTFQYSSPTGARSYAIVIRPADFMTAARTCGELGGGGLVLAPFTVVVQAFTMLSVENATLLNAVFSAVSKAVSESSRSQKGWDMWSWDVARPCRAQSYNYQAESFFASSDRPCSWSLTYCCADKRTVAAAGLTEWEMSDAWLERVRAVRPSPYGLGRAASGLHLLQSELLIGSAAAPADAVWYDGRATFWAQGPILSMMWRAHTDDGMLQALHPVHEASYNTTGWPLSAPPDSPDLLGSPADGPAMAGNNVGPWYDYVVQVQSCMRFYTVERLALVTRSGMRYQVGRMDCSDLATEDAPPGGYLAALQGWHSRGPSALGGSLLDSVRIHQLRLVWAAPEPQALPSFTLEALPRAAVSACATARLDMQARPPATPGAAATAPMECGASSGLVCPSNQCCGATSLRQTEWVPLQLCGRGMGPCQVSCRVGYGMCGGTSELQSVLFAHHAAANATAPAAAWGTPGQGQPQPQQQATVYWTQPALTLSYTDADLYCRNLALLGLRWQLVAAEDVVRWPSWVEMRWGAYADLLGKPLWVAVDPRYVAAGPSFACLRASFAPMGEPLPLHTLTPATCLGSAGVVCRASAGQAATTVAVPPAPPPVFVQGRTLLSVSGALGAGPSGPGCRFQTINSIPLDSKGGLAASNATAAPPGGNASAATTSAALPAGTALPAYLTLPLTAVRLSVAAALVTGAGGGNTEQLCALQLVMGGVADEEQGAVSSGGWHTFELQRSEVITAVSGCAGGFVERLVFHTSLGRRWTPPLTRTSMCTTPFLEAAPPGGYLVGMQGVKGYYIEQLQLVWGRPMGLVPPPGSGGGGGGSERRRTIGVGVGVGVGITALMVLVVGVGAALVHRRRRNSSRDSPKIPRKSDGSRCAPADVASRGATTPDAEGAAASATASRRCHSADCDSALFSSTDTAAGATVRVEMGPLASAPSLELALCGGLGSGGAAGQKELEPALHHCRAAEGLPEDADAAHPQEQWPQRQAGCDGRGGASTTPCAAAAAPAAAMCSSAAGASWDSTPDRARAAAAAGAGALTGPQRAAPGSCDGVAGVCGRAAASASAQLQSWRLQGPQRRGSTSEVAMAAAGVCAVPSTFQRLISMTGNDATRHFDVVWPPREEEAEAEAAELRADPSLNMVLGRDVEVEAGSYLGHGASGVVRRGVLHSPEGGVAVAVKLLNSPDGTEAEAGVHQLHLAGLAQEVRVLSRLSHPNIVRFYGACLDPRSTFLVEELMASSLVKLVHGKSRATGSALVEYGLLQVLRLSRDMAAGLAYLHPTVLHRDLKPSNVLLDETGTAKLGDFGLARFKAHTALTTREVEVGTAPYMAPEVFTAQENGKVTDRADVYSLGVIINELSTRRRPWEGMRDVVVAYQVAMERQRPSLAPPDHPLCPPPLRSLIERCWRHNPEERPSSAEIVKRLTLLLAEHGGGGGGGGGSSLGNSTGQLLSRVIRSPSSAPVSDRGRLGGGGEGGAGSPQGYGGALPFHLPTSAGGGDAIGGGDPVGGSTPGWPRLASAPGAAVAARGGYELRIPYTLAPVAARPPTAAPTPVPRSAALGGPGEG